MNLGKRNEICVERVQQSPNHINSIRTSPYIGLTQQDFNETINQSDKSPKEWVFRPLGDISQPTHPR